MKFEVFVTVKNGYKPIMQDETVNEWSFVVTAPNRATADRMASTILSNNPNVVEWDSICIED